MSNTYNFLLRFADWKDFDVYMKSTRKVTLWYMLLEYTNYDWPHSYKKTTKRMIVDYFSEVFYKIIENRERIKEECSFFIPE